MALTKNRDTIERDGRDFGFTVASDAIIYQGAMVGLDSNGLAVPASGTGNTPLGVAMGSAKANEMVVVRRGCFAFDNSSTDAVARVDIGKVCYVVDDCTVKKTVGSPAAPVAGLILDVDSAGVWVKF